MDLIQLSLNNKQEILEGLEEKFLTSTYGYFYLTVEESYLLDNIEKLYNKYHYKHPKYGVLSKLKNRPVILTYYKEEGDFLLSIIRDCISKITDLKFLINV